MLVTLLTISLTPSNKIIAESENNQTNCEQQSQDPTSCTNNDATAADDACKYCEKLDDATKLIASRLSQEEKDERFRQAWQKFVDPKNLKRYCEYDAWGNDYIGWRGYICQGCSKSFAIHLFSGAKRACWRHSHKCKSCYEKERMYCANEMFKWHCLGAAANMDKSLAQEMLEILISQYNFRTFREMQRFLLEKGQVNPNDPVKHSTVGEMPLFFSAKSLDQLKFLVKYGADLHKQDNCKNLGLHHTMERVDLSAELVPAYNNQNVDANTENGKGETPLHVLARNCSNYFSGSSVSGFFDEEKELLKKAQFLIDGGADPTNRTRKGTPLDQISNDAIEKYKRCAKLAVFLQKAEKDVAKSKAN